MFNLNFVDSNQAMHVVETYDTEKKNEHTNSLLFYFNITQKKIQIQKKNLKTEVLFYIYYNITQKQIKIKKKLKLKKKS